jgi:hypothetical protein
MLSKKDVSKTNIFIIDKNLWKWAKYKSDVLGFISVSEYIFQLIKNDKESEEKK